MENQVSKIEIEFDDEEETHSLDLQHISINHLVIAIKSLSEEVEEKTGMPASMLILLTEKECKDD